MYLSSFRSPDIRLHLPFAEFDIRDNLLLDPIRQNQANDVLLPPDPRALLIFRQQQHYNPAGQALLPLQDQLAQRQLLKRAHY